MFIVYIHTNKFNGKMYIGITSQPPKNRWRDGVGYVLGYKNKTYFYNAILKYGWDNFSHEILFEGLTEDEAKAKEVELIAKWKTNNRAYGYNLTEGGEGTLGFRNFSIEQRERRSEFMKNRIVSEETRKRMSAARKGKPSWNSGKTLDDAYKRKISENHGHSKKVTIDGIVFRNITEGAKHIGVTRKTLSDWLAGNREIPKKHLHREIKFHQQKEGII